MIAAAEGVAEEPSTGWDVADIVAGVPLAEWAGRSVAAIHLGRHPLGAAAGPVEAVVHGLDRPDRAIVFHGCEGIEVIVHDAHPSKSAQSPPSGIRRIASLPAAAHRSAHSRAPSISWGFSSAKIVRHSMPGRTGNRWSAPETSAGPDRTPARRHDRQAGFDAFADAEAELDFIVGR